MMPSDRKFMQRRRSYQLENSRYNNCVEQSRQFRLKELNADAKRLRQQKQVLERKAASTVTLLSDAEIRKIEQDSGDESLENLRAWSLSKYGIIMERSSTTIKNRQSLLDMVVQPVGGGGGRSTQVKTAPAAHHISRPPVTRPPPPAAKALLQQHNPDPITITTTTTSDLLQSTTSSNYSLMMRPSDPKLAISADYPKIERRAAAKVAQGGGLLTSLMAGSGSETTLSEPSTQSTRKPDDAAKAFVKSVKLGFTLKKSLQTFSRRGKAAAAKESQEQHAPTNTAGPDQDPAGGEGDQYDYNYYRSRRTGSVLIPNPVNYRALRGLGRGQQGATTNATGRTGAGGGQTSTTAPSKHRTH
eukprot:sb/3466064/